MFTRTPRLVASVAVLVAFGGSLVGKPPAAGDADSRVIAAVNSLSYKYEVDSKGMVIVTVPTGKDKTRLVFIESKTEYKNGKEFRLIMTPVRLYDGNPPPSAARMIEEANEQLPSGRFVTIEDNRDGSRLVVFMTVAKANATTAELDSLLDSACSLAHTMSVVLKS